MLDNLTIGKKLGLNVGALLVLTMGLGIAALSSVSRVSTELDTAVNKTAVKLDLVQGIGKRALETSSDSRGAALSYINGDQQGASANELKMQGAYKRLGEMIRDVTPLLSPEGKRHMDAVVQALAQIQPLQIQYLDLSKSRKPAEAYSVMNDRLLPLSETLDAEIFTIVKLNRGELAASSQKAIAVESVSRWIVAAVLGLTFAMGVVALLVVRGIRRTLAIAVDELSQGADQITSAAAQVASSSQSLAQGSSEQAAAIEETSASTEEINSMSQKNADNSRSMAKLSDQSQQMFIKTNGQLDEMVVSMEEINQSSGKIAKIIKVIDEIAFQTNILALNAAVEAARAGEAGLGFAVVADEVRNLAQRSAQAAKDTEFLIQDSISRSKSGVTKVGQVAAAVRGVTGDSSEMKKMADEVSVGSVEQSRGLQQISRAITQMEQTTQATAASAEESAAAAEQLSAQSETMRDVVTRLKAMIGG
jgi:methyl-accepting chemotaxis protein